MYMVMKMRCCNKFYVLINRQGYILFLNKVTVKTFMVYKNISEYIVYFVPIENEKKIVL